MTGNPFMLPTWLMLATGMIISWLIDIPYHTLIGLLAYIPWLLTLGASLWWNRWNRRQS